MYDRTAFLRIVMFGLMVSVATIALPAASFQTQATLWSVFDGVTKVCEQSNNPVFTESTAPETGNPPWTWSVTNIRGFAGSADFSFVRMNADGTQAALHWTAIETSDWRTSGGCEGLFDLTLTNGVDADVTYPDFQVSLRYLALSGYTVFKGQTGGGRGIPASDPHTYTFNVIGFGGTMPGDLSMTMNNVGAVTEVSGTIAGTEDDTMDVRILDGSRPYSDLTGIPLSLRRIVPEILTVPNNGGAGSINLEVGGDAGPWDWFDYEDGLDNSVLTGPDSFGSSSLTVSWAAGALETDETGAGAVTIQRSYGSSPPSTVALETVITEAAPMPVSCWPILAASLAIVAVVLMMSRKYSTVA